MRRGGEATVPAGFGPDGDDDGCHFLHVDMDAFFASVEIRRRPQLRGKPVVVGGTGPRGVVAAASYEARAYGVHSAMPTAQARARCPQAVFLQPDRAAYEEASAAVMGLLREITPLVEQLSVDEAFLDVAGARRLFGRPARIAALIRHRIATEQRLTCTVGVAPNKFLAKLGSTWAKPDGLIVIPATRTLEFLHPLPVGALWGVGERTEQALRRLGLRTVADVAHAPEALLRSAIGRAAAAQLRRLAWGQDSRAVRSEHVEKSLSAEVTFEQDCRDADPLRRVLLSLAQKVGGRARAAGLAGRTVSIKVRFADFRTVSRSRTMPNPTDVARDIFDVAWQLFSGLGAAASIRLLGVRLEGLVSADEAIHQPLLDEVERGWRAAEMAVDAVVARFGSGAVQSASLLAPHSPQPTQNPAPGMVVPLSEPPAPS